MSSPLRDRLRARLVIAMRERDRESAAALRSAIARIDNAEAIPLETLDRSDDPQAPSHAGSPAAARTVATSEDVAGAVLGLGAAERSRLELDEADEIALVHLEIAELAHAGQTYAASGHVERAAAAERAGEVLRDVLGR